MRSSQTAVQRTAKSKGQRHPDDTVELNGASELHAVDRLGSGFDLLEVVSEYRALRASVLRLWSDSSPDAEARDVDDVTRFNESIDQSLVKAVGSYTKRVDQSRDLFLAILSHDLRNPLNTIAMSAALLARQREPAGESTETASQISTSASLMGRMISDLLDYTRTRLGAGMPVSPQPIDMGKLCREIHDEYRSGFPERIIRIECEGDLTGNWDPDRMRQAVSNLLGNALQHGAAHLPVKLTAKAEGTNISIAIQNSGPPIPAGEVHKIFEPLIRGSSAGRPLKNRPGSIGLGLYIAREIVLSHAGTIEVVSSEQSGTIFTIHLPRVPLTPAAPILDEKHLQTL